MAPAGAARVHAKCDRLTTFRCGLQLIASCITAHQPRPKHWHSMVSDRLVPVLYTFNAATHSPPPGALTIGDATPARAFAKSSCACGGRSIGFLPTRGLRRSPPTRAPTRAASMGAAHEVDKVERDQRTRFNQTSLHFRKEQIVFSRTTVVQQ